VAVLGVDIVWQPNCDGPSVADLVLHANCVNDKCYMIASQDEEEAPALVQTGEAVGLLSTVNNNQN